MVETTGEFIENRPQPTENKVVKEYTEQEWRADHERRARGQIYSEVHRAAAIHYGLNPDLTDDMNLAQAGLTKESFAKSPFDKE